MHINITFFPFTRTDAYPSGKFISTTQNDPQQHKKLLCYNRFCREFYVRARIIFTTELQVCFAMPENNTQETLCYS